MSAATAHAHASAPPKEEYFRYTNMGPTLFGLAIGTAVGLVLWLLGAFTNHESPTGHDFYSKQLLFSWLFAFMFFFTISMGALFWHMVHFAFDAEWTVVVRRLLETMSNSFSVIWIAFIPILIGAHKIYEWMNIPVGVDPPLDAKRALLNPTTWAVMTVLVFSFFFTASYTLRWLSTRQDVTGDPGCTTKSRTVAFASIPFFGILLTAAAIFWVMSISYHWYSTMWGVYVFAGSAWSSMAALIIVAFLLRRAGYLEGVVSTEHFHIMGKLLLSFTVFWAYISFSQYFLIWYANIPEETEYYLVRNTESWNLWAIFLEVGGHFFLVFALLLRRGAKTGAGFLASVAVLVLFLHACDWYFVVNPFLHEKGVRPLTMIADLGALLSIGCPLVGLFIYTLGKHSLYPLRDPRLPESLRLVN